MASHNPAAIHAVGVQLELERRDRGRVPWLGILGSDVACMPRHLRGSRIVHNTRGTLIVAARWLTYSARGRRLARILDDYEVEV